VDILADGSLDYPDDLLAALDYTICSIHSRFRLSSASRRKRVLRAMDHPAFTILGHANRPVAIEAHWLRTGFVPHHRAREGTRCFFEINADPDRLDLSSDNVRQVAEAGIKVAIGTDAHRAAGLDYMHVVSTWPAAPASKSRRCSTRPLCRSSCVPSALRFAVARRPGAIFRCSSWRQEVGLTQSPPRTQRSIKFFKKPSVATLATVA